MRKKSADTTVKYRQAHGESRIMKFILGIYVTQTHLARVAGANRGAGRGGGREREREKERQIQNKVDLREVL